MKYRRSDHEARIDLTEIATRDGAFKASTKEPEVKSSSVTPHEKLETGQCARGSFGRQCRQHGALHGD
jgi:hypothetical protein